MLHEQVLKQHNLKCTKRRKMILEILDQSKHSMTAEEVYRLTCQQEPVSLSTVYRALSALAEKGIVIQTNHDGTMYYQYNNHQHVHYLRCISCQEIVPLEGCPLEWLEQEWGKKTGYDILGHQLELTGLCPACKKLQKKTSR